jgi:hypothetical protein
MSHKKYGLKRKNKEEPFSIYKIILDKEPLKTLNKNKWRRRKGLNRLKNNGTREA